MRLALEDISIGNYEARFGPEQRFRWEESRRRVRAEFAGVMVADSRKAMLLLESGRLPVYYFPMVDVRMDLLEPTPHRTHSALKGDASYWMLRVGDRVAEKAAWGYSDPPRDGPPVRGYISFYWDKMDAWYEEEERVFGHARDPYHRVDILRSSRHVRIELGGVTIAETRRPRMLLETQLPVRYYIPEQDVRMDLLAPTNSVSYCPYKGKASYWSATVDDKTYKDIVWSYRDVLPACTPIKGLLCFYDERVDATYVDGELVVKPNTPWSD